MKKLKQILSALALFAAPCGLQALSPVSTFTFVDPCFPFTSVTAIAATNNCYAYTITSAMPSDPGSYYTWHFGDGQTAQGKSLYHCYSVSANAQQVVSVTNNSPGCANTAYDVYTLTLSPPTASNCAYDPTITVAPPSVTVCCGTAIPEISFTYNYGDGTADTHTETHTYAACGSYIVKRKMFDMTTPPGECYSFLAVNIPCAVVPTGIEQNAAGGGISLFPNPAADALNIVSASAVKNIKIFDLLGKQVLATDLNEGSKATVNIKNMEPGTYFILLQLENGSQKNMKFIKR